MQPQPEQPSVSVVGEYRLSDGQICDVVRCQRDSAESLRAYSDQADVPGVETVRTYGFHPHRFAELRPCQNLPFAQCALVVHPLAAGVVVPTRRLNRSVVVMLFVPSEEPPHLVGARLLHGGRCFVGLRPESALPACRSSRSAVWWPGWAGRVSLSAVRTSCAAQPPDERPDRDAVDVQDVSGEVDPNACGVGRRSVRRASLHPCGPARRW